MSTPHDCSECTNLLVTGGFCYDFAGSKAASCMHFQGQNTCCGSLNRVTERVFEIVSNFIEASKNLYLDFFSN